MQGETLSADRPTRTARIRKLLQWSLPSLVFVLVLAIAWPRVPKPSPPLLISITQSNGPVRVFPGIAGACFILPDGSLWTWGNDAQTPTQVGTNCDWLMSLMMNNHSLGLKTNGTLWEWGYRGAGQRSVNPAQVDPRTNWVGIAGGDVHSVALSSDGTIWAWGDNANGQLGSGTGLDTTNLTQVGSSADWSAIAAGQGSYTLGLKRDGSLWTWGLTPGGSGKPLMIIFPQQLSKETNWARLVTMTPFVETERTGELWYAFANAPSGLATSNACSLIVTNWQPGITAGVAAGLSKNYFYLHKLKPDGTLWRCKYVPFAGMSSEFERVGQRSDWVKLWGYGTAYGLTSDGTIWAIGADFGAGSKLNSASMATRMLWDFKGYLHLPRQGWQGSGGYLLRSEPWPLMHIVQKPAK